MPSSPPATPSLPDPRHLSRVPAHLRGWYELNPLVGIIEGFRAVLLRNEAPDLQMLGFSFLVTMVILLITWPLFRILSQYFADVM